jgi:DNA (cytosine-5)-methyltransferase 1
MALRPRNILSLCAGVGGLELGIALALDALGEAARGICYVEREASAAASLVASMEAGWLHPAPVWSDAGTFDARPWRGLVHCVASGDPCQPNSVAGKGLGAADDRWLIDQLLRVVDECRPGRVFRENVTGNADGQLAAIVPALERLGYRVASGVFSAAQIGAGHRRERLFILADSDRDGFGRRSQSHFGSNEPGQPASRRSDVAGRDDHPRVLADADCRRRSRLKPGAGSGEGTARCQRREQASRAEGSGTTLAWPGSRREGLPAFAPGPSGPRWPDILARAPELEPAIRRVADGLAYRTERLRACGNGVVPLAAANAWLSLGALLAEARGSGAAVVRESSMTSSAFGGQAKPIPERRKGLVSVGFGAERRGKGGSLHWLSGLSA